LDTKKQDTLKEYFAKGYSTRDIPLDELSEYCIADIKATQQLADKQIRRLNSQSDAGLMGTVDLTNQAAVCLARIYQRGFAVDFDALDVVRQEFEQERDDLEKDLQAHVRRLMGGATPLTHTWVSPTSVVYSRVAQSVCTRRRQHSAVSVMAPVKYER
jgi:DNA polymerase I-like protein with 3'-5' exonuclease and polymerase domains